MKNWLTIGQISKKVGLSPKALRMYEKMGLISSHTRGENGYRYYQVDQLAFLQRLKEFKTLGFSLAEIKSLLAIDAAMDAERLKTAMQLRLALISEQAQILQSQKKQIESILSSLDSKTEPLRAQQRRAIMNHYGKISIVVTGSGDLEAAAGYIQKHFKKAHQAVPVLSWQADLVLPEVKPYILILNPSSLKDSRVGEINPDTIVITQLDEYSNEIEALYLKLYGEVGPHMTTVFNADDRASVALAASEVIRQGRTFYFSKNGNLVSQIKSIGGVVGDSDEVSLYGFNLSKEVLSFKYGRIVAIAEETALLSSLGAVLTVGLDKAHLQVP